VARSLFPCIHAFSLYRCRYPKREVHNLARFISIAKFRPLSWRAVHPYILADRFEDLTPPERVIEDTKCDRNVALFGYLRGSNLKLGMKVCVHLAFSQFWGV
jgi:ribosome biogenesis protein BMS1